MSRNIYATSAGVYSTDGTSDGTTLLVAAGADFVPQPGAPMVTLPNGKVLFFGLVNPNLDLIGAVTSSIRIWETDGTVAGTAQTGTTVAPDGLSRPGDYIGNVVEIGNRVSFAFQVPGTNPAGAQTYITDGTTAGTAVQDVAGNPQMVPQFGLPGTGAVTGGNSAPRYVYATSAGVYATDGTDAGTTLLVAAGADFVPQTTAKMVTLPNGKVLFFGLVNPNLDQIGAVTSGIRIWETDGTAAGTAQTGINFAPDSLLTAGDNIANVVAIGTEVSFAFNIPSTGSVLYATDGTTAGTVTAPTTLPQTGLSNGADTLCFRSGTLIQTEAGEVAVEVLREGDQVDTVFGGSRTIKWIGRQSFAGRFLRQVRAPVCFHPNSIADNVPTRDLYVSPAHNMLIDGRLVPASLLINGATITQTESDEQVDYVHLDFGVHDCVIANGAASESYAEQNNRTMFNNKPEFDAAFPGHVPVFQPFCLPQVQPDSAELNTIRAMLLSRVPEPCCTDDPDLHLLADGVRIEAERIDHLNWIFAIPAGVRDLRLASRTSRPSAFGQSADVRDLGFCIEQISSEQAAQTVVLKAHHRAFEIGAYQAEALGDASWRWTNGLCVLPQQLLLGQPGEAALITVRGHARDRYVVPLPRAVRQA